MPRIYVLKESINDPVVTKMNLVDYEASVDARFDETATHTQLDEAQKKLEGSLDELESRCSDNLDSAKEEIKDLIQSTKEDMQGIVDSTKAELQKLMDTAKQELQKSDQDMKAEIMAILEEIKVKASEAEPEDAEDFTVWFDIVNKLVKVRKDGEWIPMGAVYQ